MDAVATRAKAGRQAGRPAGNALPGLGRPVLPGHRRPDPREGRSPTLSPDTGSLPNVAVPYIAEDLSFSASNKSWITGYEEIATDGHEIVPVADSETRVRV